MKRFFKFCRCVVWVVRSSWRALPHGPYSRTPMEAFSICLWHLTVVMPFPYKSVLKQSCWVLALACFWIYLCLLHLPKHPIFSSCQSYRMFLFYNLEKTHLNILSSWFLFICIQQNKFV